MQIEIVPKNSQFSLIRVAKVMGLPASIAFAAANPQAADKYFNSVIQAFENFYLDSQGIKVTYENLKEYRGHTGGTVKVFLNDSRGIDEHEAFANAKSLCASIIGPLAETGAISRLDRELIDYKLGVNRSVGAWRE